MVSTVTAARAADPLKRNATGRRIASETAMAVMNIAGGATRTTLNATICATGAVMMSDREALRAGVPAKVSEAIPVETSVRVGAGTTVSPVNSIGIGLPGANNGDG